MQTPEMVSEYHGGTSAFYYKKNLKSRHTRTIREYDNTYRRNIQKQKKKKKETEVTQQAKLYTYVWQVIVITCERNSKQIPLNKSKIYVVCRQVTSGGGGGDCTYCYIIPTGVLVRILYTEIPRAMHTRFFATVVLHASCAYRLFQRQIFVSRSPRGLFVGPI